MGNSTGVCHFQRAWAFSVIRAAIRASSVCWSILSISIILNNPNSIWMQSSCRLSAYTRAVSLFQCWTFLDWTFLSTGALKGSICEVGELDKSLLKLPGFGGRMQFPAFFPDLSCFARFFAWIRGATRGHRPVVQRWFARHCAVRARPKSLSNAGLVQTLYITAAPFDSRARWQFWALCVQSSKPSFSRP